MLSIRYAAPLLVFLGAIPVAIYLGVSTYLALSFACIVLIAATLYISFSPSEAATAHTNADAR